MSDAPGRPLKLITQSGWYRWDGKGWVRVPDEEAEQAHAEGRACDLVRADIGGDVVEEPLW